MFNLFQSIYRIVLLFAVYRTSEMISTDDKSITLSKEVISKRIKLSIDGIQSSNLLKCSRVITQIITPNNYGYTTNYDFHKSLEIEPKTFKKNGTPYTLISHNNNAGATIKFHWGNEQLLNRFTKKPAQFIFIIKNIQQVLQRLADTYFAPFWNRRAFFQIIIIGQDIKNDQISIIMKILIQFYNIFNFALVLTRNLNSFSCQVITIKNHNIKNCGKEFTPIQMNCTYGTLINRFKLRIHDVDMYDSFRSCPVRAFQGKGINIGSSMLWIFASKSKFNISIQIINTSSKKNAKERFNPYRLQQSYLSINSWAVPPWPSLLDSVPVAYVYDSSILLFIPSPKPVAPWKTATHSVSLGFWITSVASFILVSLTFWTLEGKKCNLSLYCFDIFSINITNSLAQTRVPSSFRIRVLLIFWIVYSMHFIVAFSTGYYDSLVNPAYAPQLKTFRQLYRANKTIYIDSSIISFVENLIGKVTYEIKSYPDMLRDIDPYQDCFMYGERYIRPLGSRHPKCFKLFIYPKRFHMRWYFFEMYFKQIYFDDKLTMMMLMMHQAGFQGYFDVARQGKNCIPGSYWKNDRYCSVETEVFALEIKHAIIPLGILLMGSLICAAVLLGEMCVFLSTSKDNWKVNK